MQTQLAENSFSGQLFVFPGRRGAASCGPGAESGSVHLTGAQLSMLLEGIDWRRPQRTQAPQLAVVFDRGEARQHDVVISAIATMKRR